jgi:hypothetical protein
MSDVDYFVERAGQEMQAAMQAFDVRVRNLHLELADAYAFRASEMRRSHIRFVKDASAFVTANSQVS